MIVIIFQTVYWRPKMLENPVLIALRHQRKDGALSMANVNHLTMLGVMEMTTDLTQNRFVIQRA